MEELLLHPRTRRQFERFVGSSNHALLITGLHGAGKQTVALSLARQLFGGKDLSLQPYFKHIVPDRNSVSIEQIRQLHNFVQLKTTGAGLLRRVIVISEADTMTEEAQNALLKLLEEPPADTVLILTAVDTGKMKQTILSRVQSLSIDRVNTEDATDYFISRYTAKDIAWAHALSDGQPGLMTALLSGKDEHPMVQQIQVAKQILSASVFDRLCKVDEIGKSKDSLPDFMYACKRICISALEAASQKDAPQQISAWHKRLSAVVSAEEGIQNNVNSKLLLTDLFVRL